VARLSGRAGCPNIAVEPFDYSSRSPTSKQRRERGSGFPSQRRCMQCKPSSQSGCCCAPRPRLSHPVFFALVASASLCLGNTCRFLRHSWRYSWIEARHLMLVNASKASQFRVWFVMVALALNSLDSSLRSGLRNDSHSWPLSSSVNILQAKRPDASIPINTSSP
jgi:hypothetical protein